MSILPSLPTPNLGAQSLIPAPSAAGERVFTDGTFKGYRFHVAVPTKDQQHGVNSLEKKYSKRLQIIKRPLRDGADINFFGENETPYSAEIEFHGPNYLAEFDSFLQICREDSAGTLVLPDMPKAVLAVFQEMSVRSATASGESLLVSASWVGAGSKPSKSLAAISAAAAGDQVGAALSASSKLEVASSKAQDVIRKNAFMQGVQSVYGKLSQGRSSINAVLKASNAQRKAILDASGNIQATLGLANSIGDRVLSFVTKKATGASRSIAEPTFAPAEAIDAQTGQQVADYAEPETVALLPDPLAKPSVVPAVQKAVPGVETSAGAELALTKVADSLKADAEILEQISGGRTEDITRAIGAVRTALVDLANTVKPVRTVPYLLPVEMSIHEVLFNNGVAIDETMRVLEKNAHVEDELSIPAGTVVYL